jgi:hypothetical protein
MGSEKVVATTNDQWKLAYEGQALMVSSGLVYTRQTKPKGLHLEDVVEMITEHPRRSYYQRTLRRRLTLGDALAQSRLKDLGKDMDFNVSVNLIAPVHDRDFEKLPNTGGQLLRNKYRSKPRRA